VKDWRRVLDAVHNLIADACQEAGRAADTVDLLAVSKTQSVESIRALAASGQRAFGENYLSEALPKIEQLADLNLEWHFIGPIQSNKTKAIAQHFDWVHSIDREKILRRLSRQRPTQRPPLNCCLQVKLGNEVTKSGVPPESALELAAIASRLPNLQFRGLMSVPPPSPDPAQQRAWFRQLAQLRMTLGQRGLATDTLSMGMSGDLAAAIAEGATVVRIGTALFGSRNKKDNQ